MPDAIPQVEPPQRAIGEIDTNRVYYLSGPMTGYPKYNYPAFEEAAAILRNTGLTILSPHENPWPDKLKMSQDELWRHMMKLAHDQMNQCDDIILLKGWPNSRGARIELDYMLTRTEPAEVWYFHDYFMTKMSQED